jgi:hypothetical protein
MAITAVLPTDPDPSYQLVTLTYVDRAGDQRSVSNKVPAAATYAQVRAAALAAGAATQAVLYAVSIAQVYEGARNAAAALIGAKNSVDDNVVISFKGTFPHPTQQAYIPAPIPAMFVANGENVDRDNDTYEAFRDAMDALLGLTYTPNTVRFTERREINDSTGPA